MSGSCLLRDEIKRELVRGNIKIYPFKKELLREASYDVTLANEFMVQTNVGSLASPRMVNIWSEEKGKGLEEEECLSASGLWEPRRAKPTQMEIRGKTKKVEVLVLEPKEMVLGHTREFVGTSSKISTLLSTRSSAARSCLFTCQCSFFGNPGFFDRWTLEITNNSFRYKIPIVVEESISSMIFLKTSGYDEESSKEEASIPSDEELEEMLNSKGFLTKEDQTVISSWNPEKMRSKLSKPDQ